MPSGTKEYEITKLVTIHDQVKDDAARGLTASARGRALRLHRFPSSGDVAAALWRRCPRRAGVGQILGPRRPAAS